AGTGIQHSPPCRHPISVRFAPNANRQHMARFVRARGGHRTPHHPVCCHRPPRPQPQRQPRGATTHGAAGEGKLGGFSAPTQDVAVAAGAGGNETITAWAQGDAGETKCPTPGMLMMVALDRRAAAAFAPARDVNVSKLPEMRSVGMRLATGWSIASRAGGALQTPRQTSVDTSQPPKALR